MCGQLYQRVGYVASFYVQTCHCDLTENEQMLQSTRSETLSRVYK